MAGDVEQTMDTKKREGSSDAEDVLSADVVLMLNPHVSLGQDRVRDAQEREGRERDGKTAAWPTAPSAPPAAGKIALSGLHDQERELLSLTDGHRSVGELIAQSTLSPVAASGHLKSLLDRGILVPAPGGAPLGADLMAARAAEVSEAAFATDGPSALTKAIDDYLELAASVLTGADLEESGEPATERDRLRPGFDLDPVLPQLFGTAQRSQRSGGAVTSNESAGHAIGGATADASGSAVGSSPSPPRGPEPGSHDRPAAKPGQAAFRPNVTAFWIPSMVAEAIPGAPPSPPSMPGLPITTGPIPSVSPPANASGPVVVVTGSPTHDGTARAPAQVNPNIPFRVGGYEVATRIAQGGMGSIYVCRRAGESGFQRLFTLKVVRQHSAQKDEAVRSFKREAHVGSMLHHPNLQTVLDVGSYKDQPFLVLDYIEGTSLSELISEERRAPLPVIIAIILDVLRGLQHAHGLVDEKGARLGLVHADVSPQNVLVGIDGIARLTDFGSSSFHGEGRLHEPKWMGTGKPAYMAPEQLRAEPLDGRADLFAVGILMWSALTGQKLFAGETYDETIIKVLRKKIPPPSSFGTPAFLDDVCLKALSRSREGRFATAEEMARELLRVATEENVLASPADVGQWVRRESGEGLAEQRRRIQLMFGGKGPSGRINTPFAPRVGAATVVLDSQKTFHTPKLGANKTLPSRTVHLSAGFPDGRPAPKSFWRTWNVVIVSALLALPVTLTIGYFVSNLLVSRARQVEPQAEDIVDAAVSH